MNTDEYVQLINHWQTPYPWPFPLYTLSLAHQLEPLSGHLCFYSYCATSFTCLYTSSPHIQIRRHIPILHPFQSTTELQSQWCREAWRYLFCIVNHNSWHTGLSCSRFPLSIGTIIDFYVFRQPFTNPLSLYHFKNISSLIINLELHWKILFHFIARFLSELYSFSRTQWKIYWPTGNFHQINWKKNGYQTNLMQSEIFSPLLRENFHRECSAGRIWPLFPLGASCGRP